MRCSWPEADLSPEPRLHQHQGRRVPGRAPGLLSRSIVHTNQDLAPYPTLNDQLDYRVALVRGWLAQEGFDLSSAWPPWWAGAASSPTSWPGAIGWTTGLLDCLRHHTVFDHASNLGGLMAPAFAQPLNIPAFIYDAVTSDELLPEARVTGFREVTRTSFCHVLNARATAHKYAQAMGRTYEDMNLVVAHSGRRHLHLRPQPRADHRLGVR